MKGDRIKYRSGYKYQTVGTYSVQLVYVRPDRYIETEFITLTPEGLLTIKHLYAWDGASGPTFDTPDSMRGSLVHDALYQLIREGHLPKHPFRKLSDKELRIILLEDGMNSTRAEIWYDFVRSFGWGSVEGDGGKHLCEAP